MSRRVVITGLGAVSPLGNTVDELWNGIKESRSGIGNITHFDVSEYPAKIAGEVRDLDPSPWMDKKEARKMDDFTLYSAVGAVQAFRDAGLDNYNFDPTRAGVIIGNGIGGIQSLETAYKTIYLRNTYRVPPMTIPKLIINEGPANVAILLNFQGPCYPMVTACSAGTDAIGSACKWIESGETDIMISGGSEAAITMMGIAGFCVLQTLSTRNDEPTKASRPFDKDRDGFVMGEGAGILVLEELEHAKARGAKIYAEVTGYGMTCDAFHLTSPHENGIGAVRAMRIALEKSGMKPEDIDYVNAHGTSTPINDPIETAAIKEVFGEHAISKKLKVSSTKSMTGHCIGAAGGIEAIISIKAIEDQFFPPTINLDEPDEKCDLDYVPNKGYHGEINAVMSNSLGFGGHNGIAIFKKYTE